MRVDRWQRYRRRDRGPHRGGRGRRDRRVYRCPRSMAPIAPRTVHETRSQGVEMDPRRDKVAGAGLFVATLLSIFFMLRLRADMARTCVAYPVDLRWSSFRVMEVGFVVGSTLVLAAAWRGLVGW